MAGHPPAQKPRQPKLRSSCDRCGAAKLKCDRGQPECGRCIASGITCVYGESRKFGRPPRHRPSVCLATPPSSSHASEQPEEPADRETSAGNSGGGAWSTALDDSGTAVSSAVMMSLGSSDGLHSDLDLHGPTPPPLDFSEWSVPDCCWSDHLLQDDPHSSHGLSSMPDSPPGLGISEDACGTHHHNHHQTRPDSGNSNSNSNSTASAASIPVLLPSIRDHDCLREAHEILGNLSILNVVSKGAVHCGNSTSETTTTTTSPPHTATTSSSSSTPGGNNSVPLDHVLRINREASDRLGRLLLLCSCDRAPHLQLLYASIISRVLVWYQQATDCSSGSVPVPQHHDTALWAPGVTGMDGVGVGVGVGLGGYGGAAGMIGGQHHMGGGGGGNGGGGVTSSPGGGGVGGPGAGSGSGSGASSVSWGSVGAGLPPGVGGPAVQALMQSTGLAVAPAAMAIGTFNVDDLGMQAALKIQLLSGELRRAGRLIDLFTSFHSAGQCLADVSTFGGVSNLYQVLDSWLRGEHLRIANLMRSKLRELNADLV